MIRVILLIGVVFLFGQAKDPLSVIREKRFYKEGAAARKSLFSAWSGSADERPVVKRSKAFNVIRDEGFKEKEAKMASSVSTLPKADKVVIVRSSQKLYLIKNGKSFKEYSVTLGEGFSASGQRVDNVAKKCIPDTQSRKDGYYKALYLNCTSASGRNRAKKDDRSAIGNIIIHGSSSGVSWLPFFGSDSKVTPGSIVLDNDDMDGLRAAVAPDTPVEIKP